MNTKPIRIQRSRQHKQISPNGLPIVYVGRGSKWRNPFRLVKHDGIWMIKTDGSERCADILIKNCHAVYPTREAAAKDAVMCYNFWLLPYSSDGGGMMECLINELKGKNLSCWCKEGETCHADLLLKLANR